MRVSTLWLVGKERWRGGENVDGQRETSDAMRCREAGFGDVVGLKGKGNGIVILF